MPWPKDHKAKTREKIVSTASAALRTGGVSTVGVKEVMARAGLTHGAFYAHFSSKEALVRTALEYAGHQTLEHFSQRLEAVPPDDRSTAAEASYLSPQQAPHREHGCPVAALGPEVARRAGRQSACWLTASNGASSGCAACCPRASAAPERMRCSWGPSRAWSEPSCSRALSVGRNRKRSSNRLAGSSTARWRVRNGSAAGAAHVRAPKPPRSRTAR